MSFAVAAESYDRFMGRYSVPLAAVFADWALPASAVTALDVGCGPGALTSVLVDRLGAGAVAAVDPSDSFVQAARSRLPGQQLAALEPRDRDRVREAARSMVPAAPFDLPVTAWAAKGVV